MKSLIKSCWLLVALAVVATPLLADEIYVIQGKNGPTFTNKPEAGAKPVGLPALSVVPAVAVPKPSAKPAAQEEAKEPVKDLTKEPPPLADEAAADGAYYQDFHIVQPENNGSVVANTAVFEVRLAAEPALRLGDKHAFVVSINGKTVGQRYTATEFMIPEDFWEELPAPNQTMQLDASIIDGRGQVIRRAQPVQFSLRQVVRRPVVVPPVVRAPVRPLPRPKPVPEKTQELPGGLLFNDKNKTAQ